MTNLISGVTSMKFFSSTIAALFLGTSAISLAEDREAKHNIKVVAIEFDAGQQELTEEGRSRLREVIRPYAHADNDRETMAPGTAVGPGTTGAEGRTPTAQEQPTRDSMRTVATRQIESIRIAAWSDSEFNPDRSLSNQEQDLAKNRAEAVENYIKEDLRLDANISKFNMAERPGLLARTFNTEEAELKSIFARRGTAEAERDTDQPELMQIRDQGGPQKAVVIINLEDRDRN